MSYEQAEHVEDGKLEVIFTIQRWKVDADEQGYFNDGYKYEWITGSGEESDEFFISADEARRDLRDRLV